MVKLLDQRGRERSSPRRSPCAPFAARPFRPRCATWPPARYDWLVLTSPATIAMLADRSRSANVRAAVAAVGDGTAEAFRRWARRDADLRPRTFTVAALARAFPSGEGRVLCPRADIAPDGLEEALQAKGWNAERVDAYRTVFARRLPRDATDALGAGAVDAVTFTSASTVRGFVGALGACPGPAEGRVHRARDRRRGESPRAHRARRRRPAYDRRTRGCFGARFRSSPPVVRPSRDEPAADAQRPEPSGPKPT